VSGLRVVSLDLSLNATGLATTHDQIGEPRLACRTITPRRYPTETTIDHRRLHETFQAIAAALKCGPDLVVIEFLPQLSHGGSSLRLAELHGAIKHFLFAKGHRYVDVSPQHLKQYATGKGNASKTQVREHVTGRYGGLMHIGTEDEADATALLMAALDAYGSPLPDGRPLPDVPQINRKAISAMKWPELTS
jgi:crossover junction endodeoxyribonuclease RuvC